MKRANSKKHLKFEALLIIAFFSPASQVLAVQIQDGANIDPFIVANGVYDFEGDAIFSASPRIKQVSGSQVFNGAAAGGSTIDVVNGSQFNVNGGSVFTLNNISFINGDSSASYYGVLSSYTDFELNGSSVSFINNSTGALNGAGGAAIYYNAGSSALKLNVENMLFQGSSSVGSGGRFLA